MSPWWINSGLPNGGHRCPLPLGHFVNPEEYLQDFSQVSRDTVTVRGEAWTVPFSLSNQILLYNKDKFREVGLDPEQPPTSWDELVEYAHALTRDLDGDGRTDEWGLNFTTRANLGSMYAFITFLWQAGGELYSEDYTEAVFHSQAAIETAQFWIDRPQTQSSIPFSSAEGLRPDALPCSILARHPLQQRKTE